MDLIVAACRTLASRPRLQLLRALYARPDSTVKDLAATVALSPEITSHHLHLLGAFHFIQAVPSGRYVYCQIADAAGVSNKFLSELQEWLQDALTPSLNSTPIQVWNLGSPKEVDAVLMKWFTTYTHLRRLLILRQLTVQGVCTAAALAEQIGMSAAAMSRHLTKLQRRGVVEAAEAAPQRWRIAIPAVPALRRRLLGIVVRALNAR